MRLAGEAPKVLVAHLGYNSTSFKQALIATVPGAAPESARLVRDDGWTRELKPGDAQSVPGWSSAQYYPLGFDDVTAPGVYRIEALVEGHELSSAVFRIGAHQLQESVVADITAYFRSVRSSGEIDRKDRHAHFYGDDSGAEVDARGGWLDASGDYSKFLSHLTYTRMMSPQQIPLAAWALAQAADELREAHPGFLTSQHSRLRDEALHGADFLVRFQSPEGYFYTGIFDALTKILDERVITAPLQNSVRTQRWQAAYRHGGGMAIAALARAASLDDHGDFGPDDYWLAAVRGFEHLEAHNSEYCSMVSSLSSMTTAPSWRRPSWCAAGAFEALTSRPSNRQPASASGSSRRVVGSMRVVRRTSSAMSPVPRSSTLQSPVSPSLR